MTRTPTKIVINESIYKQTENILTEDYFMKLPNNLQFIFAILFKEISGKNLVKFFFMLLFHAYEKLAQNQTSY